MTMEIKRLERPFRSGSESRADKLIREILGALAHALTRRKRKKELLQLNGHLLRDIGRTGELPASVKRPGEDRNELDIEIRRKW
ncbi:hypothetical protein ABVT35_11210 [Hoeflea sp. TYP-13]